MQAHRIFGASATVVRNVCFGSLADIKERQSHVRFTPESRHSSAPVACPLSARSGHIPMRLLAITGKAKFVACSPPGGAMADLSSRRKLAAILSADVVGYSRLMAANEVATLETLKSYRDVIAQLVMRRGGRVVNAPGDAMLAEFPSAVEAIQAAVEIQKAVEGHNTELE